jgi:asparagine synthase (glutamine-hydrolysing)
MCGLTGYYGGRWSAGADGAASLVRQMAERIHHRGPDDTGVWLNADHRIALGHKRLAVVDLSRAGAQPMQSATARYVIAFNGEIYNHMDIRRALAAEGRAAAWRGHSDTETLITAIEAWGLKGALQRAIGMFALALWDAHELTLSLARDRIGEKPLYYGWQGDGEDAAFLFASELKALALHPVFRREINRDALTIYMRHGYVPAPHTIYRGIHKLRPGRILTIEADTHEARIEAYWDGRETFERGVANRLDIDAGEAVDELENLLTDAVSQQMLADVPLGAFLSGGVDSSTIVALMQRQSSRPVKTFAIGFHEEAYDEARHARAVATHLGTDHTEMYVTSGQAIDVIPSLPSMYDEPFADSSQIPTFLVSQLARAHVTVSLSGDGGDELFGGYERYHVTSRVWSWLSKLPRPLRAGIANSLTSVPARGWNAAAAAVRPLLPASARSTLSGDRIHARAGMFASRSVAELYHSLASSWRDPASVVIGGSEPPAILTHAINEMTGLGDIEMMMAVDLLTYLPDDILVKVDRAAMNVSLETRVPLLDHRVVEFAWRLPMDFRIRDGQTKWALRQVLYRHVPRALIERSKMGFGIPLGEWLRGPLRDWAEALLDQRRLEREGYFRPAPIRRMWTAHLTGRVNEQYRLWIVLMFQAWVEAQEHAPTPQRPATATRSMTGSVGAITG